MTSSGKNKSRYRASKKRTGGAAPAAPAARAQVPRAVVAQHSTPAPPGWSQGAYDALMGVGMSPESHAAMLDAARSLAAKFGLGDDVMIKMMLHSLFAPEDGVPQFGLDAGLGGLGSRDVVDSTAAMLEQMTLSQTALNGSPATIMDVTAAAGTHPGPDKDACEATDKSPAETATDAAHFSNAPADADAVAVDGADSVAGDRQSAATDKRDSTESDDTAVSTQTHPLTQSATYDHADVIMQPERHGMLVELCTLKQARILVYFAFFFICATIRRNNKSDAIPPTAFVNRLHKLVRIRGDALLRANGPFADDYSRDKSIMPSVIAHSAMLCAQEYMKVFLLDTVIAMRTLNMAVQQEQGSDADHKFLDGFIKLWLDEHSADQNNVHIHEMDGIKVGDRTFDLQVHLAKPKPWPRTIHGTRVMPFGVVDLLDKTRFDEGEKSRSCLNCRAKYKTTRAWREHLLTDTKHEVYLCCGRQFANSVAVLAHFVAQHNGGLGRLDPFISCVPAHADVGRVIWNVLDSIALCLSLWIYVGFADVSAIHRRLST